MTRIKILNAEELNAEQRAVYDHAVAGPRGRAPVPLLAWLHSPELAGHAQKLGAFLRYDTTLTPRLSELAILVVARVWTAQYEWAVHKKEALKAGIAQAIIDAIAQRQRPACESRDQLVVYNFSLSLCTTHAVPEELYREALEALGERGTVELVGLLGYYTLIAMTLNTFEIDVPEGFEAELK